eukprot:CAMPEP_0174252876 /NCGR_PEP_ID=MMETSP0439-20130205/2219_1 /TAXON_ID=0 /ORGANISM="Stereomyxa ramosa, Strain Chinc5" /LENGTH=714 /DNA_ID=CAMNT_0015333555 /DNA_START=18 /DNA_END=2162 /DNA_ORIENTATION=-
MKILFVIFVIVGAFCKGEEWAELPVEGVEKRYQDPGGVCCVVGEGLLQAQMVDNEAGCIALDPNEGGFYFENYENTSICNDYLSFTCDRPLDVVLILDTSGSICNANLKVPGENCEENTEIKNIASYLLLILPGGSHAGYVDFDTNVQKVFNISDDYLPGSEIYDTVRDILSGGFTNTKEALSVALGLFQYWDANSDSDNSRVIFLITDGNPQASDLCSGNNPPSPCNANGRQNEVCKNQDLAKLSTTTFVAGSEVVGVPYKPIHKALLDLSVDIKVMIMNSKQDTNVQIDCLACELDSSNSETNCVEQKPNRIFTIAGSYAFVDVDFGIIQSSVNLEYCRETFGEYATIDPEDCSCGCNITCDDLGEHWAADLDNCTCVCTINASFCDPGFVFDEEDCACRCPKKASSCDPVYETFNQPACSCDCRFTEEDNPCTGNDVWNDADCECDCGLTAASCDVNYEFDADACECFCGLTAEDCDANREFDEDSCSCFCPLTADDCAADFEFNDLDCQCDCVFDPQQCTEADQYFDADACDCGLCIANINDCDNSNFDFNDTLCECQCNEQAVLDECDRIFGDIETGLVFSNETTNITVVQALFADLELCKCICLLNASVCDDVEGEWDGKSCSCVITSTGDGLTTSEKAGIISAAIIAGVAGGAGILLLAVAVLFVVARKTEILAGITGTGATLDGAGGATSSPIYDPRTWLTNAMNG